MALGLDALGDEGESEVAGQADGGAQQCCGDVLIGGWVGERLIEFQLGDG